MPGLGSIPHLSVENFADALKIKVQHLPFRGDAPMLPVLIKGDIDFGAPAISSIRGNDQIRPLVMFSDKRHPAYPDVPTAKELGVTTSVPPGHNGLYAPKGLPAEVKAALERGLRQRDQARGGAARDRQHRADHRLSRRRAISGADRSPTTNSRAS